VNPLTTSRVCAGHGAESARLAELSLVGLASAFRRRILDEAGEVEGFVETARPIAAPEVERIAAEFGRVLGQKLILKNRVVPELVGGVRVIAGNRMLDGSVSGRLEALRRRLHDVPLPC